MVAVKMAKAKSGKKRLLSYGAGGVMLASLGLTLADELDAMLAWWMALVLLLPPLLWALKTRYIALITICSLAFVTQFITLPNFYLVRDEFAWGHVKPFGFTALEAFPMLAKVSVFLFALIIFFRLFYRIRFIGGSSRKLATSLSVTSASTILDRNHQQINIISKPHRKSGLYLFLLILVIAALAPLNLWMFSQGISIVGVAPPQLPYRLSGILHYFTKYIAPLALAYFYFRTKRGWLPMLLLLSYAWVLGLSSISRSSLIFVMLPVLYLAWLDRRQLMLAVASLGALIGFAFVSTSRDFVYTVSAGISGGNFDAGIGAIFFSIITDHEIKIFEIYSIFRTIVNVFGRIDGFDNLVMSQYYNLYEVIEPLGMVLGMLWQGLAPIDLDLHHIQWQGNVLIEGFFNGGGLLSNAVILGNAGLWWIVISASGVAALLATFEKSAIRLNNRYKAPRLFSTATTGFYSLSYFISGSGSPVFVYLFALIFIASLLPPLFSLDEQRRSKPKVSAAPPATMPANLKPETSTRAGLQ